MTWISDWPAQAACRGTDPDFLFVQGAAQNRVKSMCAGCTVRTECLADALDNEIEFGVWGGMTERERRALLRKRPDVISWRSLLETARINHEATVRAQVASPVTVEETIPAQQISAPVTSTRRVPAQATATISTNGEMRPAVLDLRSQEVADEAQSRQVVDVF
ncbi:MAG: WhiB family transcriptional regulator [Candidatus Nanopelagicales bacterium]